MLSYSTKTSCARSFSAVSKTAVYCSSKFSLEGTHAGFCLSEIQLTWLKTCKTYKTSNVDFSLCFYLKDFCILVSDIYPSNKTLPCSSYVNN